MPRFFFDLHNDIEAPDPDGTDLPNVDSAVEHAVSEARQIITESVRQGRLDLRHYIKVRDEAGETVAVMRFEDAVSVVREGLPV